VKFRKMLKRSDVDNDNKDAVSSQLADTPEAENPTDPAAAEGTDAQSVNPAPSEVDSLHQQIADKDKELAELRDKYLRVLADTDNARKRIRQQSEDSVRLQRENILRDLLPIVDNLERAVEAARGGSGADQPIVAGVEMVLRSLIDFLRSHGVTQVSAVGQQFDPQLHEAVDHVHSPEHPPNTVVSEFHRGYVIGDRTLRPARVTVASSHGKPHGGNNSGDSGIENG
jgi:molecular chaperone GrpE